MTYTHEFTGRCPSKAQVAKEIKKGIELGATEMWISWGENGIDIQKYNGQFYGSGWIRRVGGDDLVKELAL
jgi:hypothetical protein